MSITKYHLQGKTRERLFHYTTHERNRVQPGASIVARQLKARLLIPAPKVVNCVSVSVRVWFIGVCVCAA